MLHLPFVSWSSKRVLRAPSEGNEFRDCSPEEVKYMEERKKLSPEEVDSMSPEELSKALKSLAETQATGDAFTPTACFVGVPCSS